MHNLFKRTLLAGASILLIGAPAFGQTKTASAPPPPDPRVGILEQELRDVQQQLADIQKAQALARDQAQAQLDNTAALADLKRSTSSQYADLNSQLAATEAGRAKVTVNNGRLEVTSADGRFSAAVRGLLQYDAGFYDQSHAANLLPSAYGSDFSSGDNFRRVYLGLSGKVFGDWTYNLNFDFGGSGGTETPGHIQSVYLEYDGLAPWALRVGAFPPPTNVEDGTSSGDTIFVERNSPSDMQRNLAGGDGRDAISLLYLGERVFGALSFTGDKIGDGAKALAAAGATAAPTFNEQQALVGRLAWLPIYQDDAHWLIGVNGTYIIKPPNAVANGLANLATTPGSAALNTITLSDPPELTVDSNGYTLANTTALNANHLTQWAVETAGNWNNFYGQAGYYNFAVDRTPVAFATPSGTQIVQPSNDSFTGWYAQATWVLTGEARVYNNSIGAFTPPRPTAPFDLATGRVGCNRTGCAL